MIACNKYWFSLLLCCLLFTSGTSRANPSYPTPPSEQAAYDVAADFWGDLAGKSPANQQQNRLAIKLAQSFSRNMVLIPAGEFMMGSNTHHMSSPQHNVYLDAYYISKQELSNKQYGLFAAYKKERASFLAKDDKWNAPGDPVIGVSWEDARAFCKWLSWGSNRKLRLPTEAEWEKAASWNPETKKASLYSWGDTLDLTKANWVGKEDGYEFIAPINSFTQSPSYYGVFNMTGNIQEWCADWYQDDYYQSSPHKNPTGPAQGRLKVIRGGAWLGLAKHGYNQARYAMLPDENRTYYGFRLVLVPE